MDFEYGLTGKGWSSATLSDEGGSATVTASYLSDALGELLRSLLELTEGAATARCSWDEKPGEYRWIFTRDAEAVSLRILIFADLWGNDPDDAGEERFQTSQPLARFVRAVAEGAARVLAEYGEAGYREAWVEHDFPIDSLGKLQLWLASHPDE